MRLEELDFEFPEELIAQHPCIPRDSCRLLVLPGGGEAPVHRRFGDLPRLLERGDVLVLNDSRVLPARVAVTKSTGGRVELLFLHELEPAAGAETWEALARPSGRLRPGLCLRLDEHTGVTLLEGLGEGRWRVGLPPGMEGARFLERFGSVPLPPYIKEALREPADYQTVYARAAGSAAAPTAGLHFTGRLLEKLSAAGVESVNVTLHVGLDTFRPVTSERLEDHDIHREAYYVDGHNLGLLERARAQGRRLVAVGTTSVRVLETLYAEGAPRLTSEDGVCGHTSLFITPGYQFRAVDALLTNFHLPRTSLLALVMAFAGVDEVRRAYAEAVRSRYRFFSFGDAMLVLGSEGRP